MKAKQVVFDPKLFRRSFSRILTVLLGIAILFLSSGCSAAPVSTTGVPAASETPIPPSVEPTPAGPDQPGPGGVMKAGRIDILFSELGVEGAVVERGEAVQEPFFAVPGLILRVNGANVEVFEYPDVPSRESVSDQISPDGLNLGTALVEWVDQPNFWARDELIVLYVGKDQALIDLLTKVLGSPITQHEPLVKTETGTVPPLENLGESGPAVAAARKALGEKLAIAEDQASLVSVVLVNWPDACLGLPRAEEMCASVITPGYKVTLLVEDMAFEIHTDMLGEQVRIVE